LPRDGVRLVTFTGPGGVGKTRLAIHVASALATEQDALVAVGFLPLAQLRDPSLVAGTIAQAFGIHGDGEQQMREQLANALRIRPAILVLDNFEHLLAACPR
jgi:predicted ATPase